MRAPHLLTQLHAGEGGDREKVKWIWDHLRNEEKGETTQENATSDV